MKGKSDLRVRKSGQMGARMKVLIGILLVGIIGGIALVSRYSWHTNMGHDMGKRRMEEYGLEEEKEEYHE